MRSDFNCLDSSALLQKISVDHSLKIYLLNRAFARSDNVRLTRMPITNRKFAVNVLVPYLAIGALFTVY